MTPGTNGTTAESFYELWCEYDRATKDPGAKALGKMVMRLRDEIVAEGAERRSKTSKMGQALAGLYAVLGALWLLFAAHVFGV